MKAAVAWGPGEKLKIEEVDLAPPQKGEGLVRMVAEGNKLIRFESGRGVF